MICGECLQKANSERKENKNVQKEQEAQQRQEHYTERKVSAWGLYDLRRVYVLPDSICWICALF